MEVELEVNKTRKLLVAVLTTGCSPNSSRRGPRISPPPIPNSPAKTPEIKEYIGNLIKIIDEFHFISVLL
jgi:hypothetical protein